MWTIVYTRLCSLYDTFTWACKCIDWLLDDTRRWWSLETWSRSQDTCWDQFFRVSVSKVTGLVSVSKDFGLGLELWDWRLCMSYFFRKTCKKQLLKKRIYSVIVQNSAIQSHQWLSFLYCYAAVEKTICPLPCSKVLLNSIKTVCVPVKPQRIISATLAPRY